MRRCHVLVIGGYGFFGQRLVQRLVGNPELIVTIAGRSLSRARELRDRLAPRAQASLNAAQIDALGLGLADRLSTLSADVVVHTSGPFQQQDYRVAEACIASRTHYIDLADGRDFVTRVTALNAPAVEAGVLVASGASSVPALSSAAADHLAAPFRTIDAIDIGISPGNRTERGLSTVQSILTYCGKRIPAGDEEVFGWCGSYRHRYPDPVGDRLLSPCDVPDLSLIPDRYPGRPAVRFGAGLELAFLHRGMNIMAGMARAKLVRDWSVHAAWLKKAADIFRHWGTDAGAMHVRVTGKDSQGQRRSRLWSLIAANGDGPFVPTLAAAALIRKLQAGELTRTGAVACVGLLGLDDFRREAEGLAISMSESPP
jgi:hypothetical protein